MRLGCMCVEGYGDGVLIGNVYFEFVVEGEG